MREGVMIQAEMEAELTSLRAQIAQFRAVDGERVRQLDRVAKMTTFTTMLFAIFSLIFIAVAAWTGRSAVMTWMFPVLFASIALNFLNLALRAWRVVVLGETSDDTNANPREDSRP
jgi:hypothetical protein